MDDDYDPMMDPLHQLQHMDDGVVGHGGPRVPFTAAERVAFVSTLAFCGLAVWLLVKAPFPNSGYAAIASVVTGLGIGTVVSIGQTRRSRAAYIEDGIAKAEERKKAEAERAEAVRAKVRKKLEEDRGAE